MTIKQNRRLTKHKRFVPYGSQQNLAFGRTSFMQGILNAMDKKGYIEWRG